MSLQAPAGTIGTAHYGAICPVCGDQIFKWSKMRKLPARIPAQYPERGTRVYLREWTHLDCWDDGEVVAVERN